MSTATALTIIAISVGILAILAILGVIFMLRLVVHLIAFEQRVARELQGLRELANPRREPPEKVGSTFHDVQQAARRIGGAVGTVASLLSIVMGSGTKTTRARRIRPLVVGASLGWSLWKRRRQKKNKRGRDKKPAIPAGSDSSLTL